MKSVSCLAVAACLALMAPTAAAAADAPQFAATLRGDVVVIGNTLGLHGSPEAGLAVLTSTDPTHQAPGAGPGTTTEWRHASSAADLQLPERARIVRAELVWAASWAEGTNNVREHIGDAIRLHTPAGALDVAPGAESVHLLDDTSSSSGFPVRYYSQRADVTEAVALGGSGTYSVQGVPVGYDPGGALGAAGWSLTVVWYAPDAEPRHIVLHSGAHWVDESSAIAREQRGFCTPTSGPVTGALIVTALEGDPQLGGDSLWLQRADGISGPVHARDRPMDNVLGGLLDETARPHRFAGRVNELLRGTATAGAPHGWDIMHAPIGPETGDVGTLHVPNGATRVSIVAETGTDSFVLVATAWSIASNAPGFTGRSEVEVTAINNDLWELAITVANDGFADAHDVFLRLPSQGARFEAGSWSPPAPEVDAAAVAFGVPVGTVASGASVRVITRWGRDPSGEPPLIRPEWSYSWTSCPGQREQAEVARLGAVALDAVAPPDGSGEALGSGESGQQGEGSGLSVEGGQDAGDLVADAGDGAPDAPARSPHPADASVRGDAHFAGDADDAHAVAGCNAAHDRRSPGFVALLVLSLLLVVAWSRASPRRAATDRAQSTASTCCDRTARGAR